MSCPLVCHRMFPGVPESVAQARRFTAAALEGCPAAEDAVLAVSELAGNAVSWSRSGERGGWFVLRLVVVPGAGAVVYVSDQGPAAGRPAGEEGGRGLRIVAAISQAWGVARRGCSASAGRVHGEPAEAARLGEWLSGRYRVEGLSWRVWRARVRRCEFAPGTRVLCLDGAYGVVIGTAGCDRHPQCRAAAAALVAFGGRGVLPRIVPLAELVRVPRLDPDAAALADMGGAR